MTGAGAGRHADQARGTLGDQWQQLFAAGARFDPLGFACLVDSMHGKDGLGQIKSSDDNAQDFPLLRYG